MKNYISIKNDGLICPEDIILIGSSTKRGDSKKIGQFGSGWKFALAWILRNELEIKIFAGTEEIVVDFTVKMHRDEPIKVLTVNGQETSITSGMGEIDWKGWMALREIVSNAIDEGGEEVRSVFNPIFSGEENKTTIFIQMNGELADILRNYDSYFSFDRVPVYSNEHMSLYKKKEKGRAVIFRKGIKCLEHYEGLYDVNFQDIDINESRLSNENAFDRSFKQAIKLIDSPTILLEILKNFYQDVLPSTMTAHIRECMIQLCKVHKFMPPAASSFSVMLGDRIIIPNTWYIELRDLGLIEDVFERAFGTKKAETGDFYILEEREKDSERLTYVIKEFVVFIDKVVIVKMIDTNTISVSNNIIYVNDKSVVDDDIRTISNILSAMGTNTFNELLRLSIK